jgi:hypothetical protein
MSSNFPMALALSTSTVKIGRFSRQLRCAAAFFHGLQPWSATAISDCRECGLTPPAALKGEPSPSFPFYVTAACAKHYLGGVNHWFVLAKFTFWLPPNKASSPTCFGSYSANAGRQARVTSN